MRLKSKIPSFIFGVSIGLLVGVAFFVFRLNDLFHRLKASAASQVTVIQQPVKEVTVTPRVKDVKEKERFQIRLGKTAKMNYKEVDSLIAEDSRINVATDQLLSVKTVKLIRLGDILAGNDSMAAQVADVNEPSADTYQIEFWKTPLNSKGYRFSKNRIMLYGLHDYASVGLYEVNKVYYIKCAGQVYKVRQGSEFRPLDRVSDAELLHRIS